jgi:hypothetical protein
MKKDNDGWDRAARWLLSVVLGLLVFGLLAAFLGAIGIVAGLPLLIVVVWLIATRLPWSADSEV